MIQDIQEFSLGDNNGVYSVQFSTDAAKAALGLGSGSIQVINYLNSRRLEI